MKTEEEIEKIKQAGAENAIRDEIANYVFALHKDFDGASIRTMNVNLNGFSERINNAREHLAVISQLFTALREINHEHN